MFYTKRPATLLKKILWRRCFSVNIATFLRTPFLQNTSGRLLLALDVKKVIRKKFKRAILVLLVFWFTKLIYFTGFTDTLFIMELLRWNGCSFTVTLAPWQSISYLYHTFSVLLLNNYVIVKACSRNIKGSANLVCSDNVNLGVPVRLSFQSLPSFFEKEKPVNYTCFAKGRCFMHLLCMSLIMTTAF